MIELHRRIRFLNRHPNHPTMTRKESNALGILIIFGAIGLALFAVINAIGLLGIGLLVACVVAGIISFRRYKRRRAQRWFDQLVMRVLTTDLDQASAKRVYRSLNRMAFARTSLVRDVQILHESLQFAVTSKKRATAESRMELARKKAHEVLSAMPALVSPPVIQETRQIIAAAEIKYHTLLYLNAAEGFQLKALSLKTKKAKLKYSELARDTLEEGIHSGRGDQHLLQQAFDEAAERIHQLTA